ncbi:MAG TPA: hypothetical protein VGU74_11125 [Gemmatimonadales bacterium]|nr:hypothetical protein [Gemmatimonadales bacterium]
MRSAALLLLAVCGSVAAQDVPLVFDVENTSAGLPKPALLRVDQFRSNLTLPDPFRLFNGSLDTGFAGWERRRAEVMASLESYEIGPKPDPADVDVTATYANDTLSVVVTRKSNGRSLTLRSPIFLPSGSGPFPAVIGMTWRCSPAFPCTGTGSLPSDIFTSRSVARIPYFHDQVTTYFASSHANDAYFSLYPEYQVANGNIGQYSAWAWGVSRLIDGIQIAARQGSLPIDLSHLAVTGCSYAGKMALFAAALDERVALAIAQESGGGGMPAWRVSHAVEPNGSVEKIDNTNYTWFMKDMRAFSADSVFTLPHDHHELMAIVAPRALLATGNTDYTWLSNRSAYISARAARETYEQLGIGDRFGFYIDGGHRHCNVPDSERPVVEAFVDKFLLGRSAGTNIQIAPYPDLDYQGWMPWSLRRDIKQLVLGGTLTAKQGAGLSDKLEAALASIAAGKTKPALKQLDAFVNQATALVKTGALTAEQGAAMIGRVNSTRSRLGA